MHRAVFQQRLQSRQTARDGSQRRDAVGDDARLPMGGAASGPNLPLGRLSTQGHGDAAGAFKEKRRMVDTEAWWFVIDHGAAPAGDLKHRQGQAGELRWRRPQRIVGQVQVKPRTSRGIDTELSPVTSSVTSGPSTWRKRRGSAGWRMAGAAPRRSGAQRRVWIGPPRWRPRSGPGSFRPYPAMRGH